MVSKGDHTITIDEGDTFPGLGKGNKVVMALYGENDVRGKIGGLLESCAPFEVNNGTMQGDPKPGVKKSLVVHYDGDVIGDVIEGHEEMKHKPTKFELGNAIFTILMSMISCSLAINSYTILSTAAAEVQDIVINWETVPVVDFKVAVAGSACGSGYTNYGKFLQLPGDSKSCGCHDNAFYDGELRASSISTCDGNQTNAGCLHTSPIASTNLNAWRGSQVCVKRAGEPVLLKSGDKNVRPEPVKKGGAWKCSAGYHSCGPNSNDLTRTVCIPDSVSGCPLTYLAGENTYSDYYSSYDKTNTVSPLLASTMNGLGTKPIAQGFTYLPSYFGNPTTLSGEIRMDREHSDSWIDTTSKLGKVVNGAGALPIVELTVATHTGGGASDDGPCYGRSTGTYGDREEWTSTTTSYSSSTASTTIGEPGKCDEDDPRWRPIEVHNSRQFILENLLKNTYCSGLTSAQAIATDYFTSGTRCTVGSNAPNGCATIQSVGKTCSAADNICKNTFYQSRCGSVMMYRDAVASGSKVAMYVRHQIYWKTGCGAGDDKKAESEESEDEVEGEVSQNGVADVIKPLNRAVAAQLALLIINLLINIVIIFIASCIVCLYYPKSCGHNISSCVQYGLIPREAIGAEGNYTKFSVSTERKQALLKVCKMVPLVFCIIYVAAVTDFFVKIGAAECSDATTNKSFKTLALMLPEALNSNISTLALDVLGVLYFLYTLCFPAKDSKIHPVDSNGDIEMSKTTVSVPAVTAQPSPSTVAPAPSNELKVPAVASAPEVIEAPTPAPEVIEAPTPAPEPVSSLMTAELAVTIHALIQDEKADEMRQAIAPFANDLNREQLICKAAQKADGATFAHTASRSCIDCLQVLCEAKMDMNRQDSQGRTPFMYAAMNGKIKTVRYLFDQNHTKVHFAKETSNGKNATSFAKEYKHSNVVNFLESKGIKDSNSGCVIM